MLIVTPLAFSSGAESICSTDFVAVVPFFKAKQCNIAALKVVLPWST
jgi:hypothetical protein